MVILLLQIHRNFQRVEQYNLFCFLFFLLLLLPLLLLTPKYGTFCLYTLCFAYLCLVMHTVSLQKGEAGITAGGKGSRAAD